MSSEAKYVADYTNEWLDTKPNRYHLRNDNYLGSVFVFNGNKNIEESDLVDNWWANQREFHKLNYPFITTVGVYVHEYNSRTIAVFLFRRTDRMITDWTYLRLVPNYYEQYQTVSPVRY